MTANKSKLCSVNRQRPLDEHPPDRRCIEIKPCVPDHFHFNVSGTPHQISIHLGGWLGRLVWKLMRWSNPIWREGAPSEGYWKPILFHYVSQEARHFSHLHGSDHPGRPTRDDDNTAFVSLWKRLIQHGLLRKDDDLRSHDRWCATVETWTSVRGACDREKIEGEASFRELVKVMQQCQLLSQNPEELTPHTYRALYHAWQAMDGEQVILTIEHMRRYAQWLFMRNAPIPPEIPSVPQTPDPGAPSQQGPPSQG